MTPVWVDDPRRGHIRVGDIEGDTYHRRIDPQWHRMRVFGGGYAISSQVLDLLVRRGDVAYVALDAPTYSLVSHLKTWVERGQTHDFGHGQQVLLNEREMWEP